MADSILTNLVQQLGALVYEEFKVLRGVGDQLKSLENELRFMKKFLRNSEGKQKEHELVTELVEQIKGVAFEAEDIIETFLLNVERQSQRKTFGKAIHYPEHKVMLYGVAKQIESIKMSIDDIYANKVKYEIEMGEGSMNPHFVATLQRRRKEVDEDMVGFIDVADNLLKLLIEGPSDLQTISIVGMGGLGKTTVAKRLFNDRIIKDHFPNHAWVSVSEDYDTRQVILTILNSLVYGVDNLGTLETDELKNMLKTRLMQRKYIIILDDVWQTHMWDEVRSYFPDTNNGSRILITTRNTEVARFASRMEPHFLRFLDHEESWDLFEKRVFQGDSCPIHLKSLGIEIVQRCRGLPLSIVVIASMLASQEISERKWETTLKDVSAHLGKDEACLGILGLSYHSLPVELKPCFLYFAAFPEDYEMSVRRLIALWLAEGFIQPLGKLTREEVAEGYLDALIDRSLVQAGIRRIDGGLKTCRIHDLIRDLCIREAKCENFMLSSSEINNSSSKPRRLSVHRHTTRIVSSKDLEPSSIRALLSFETQRSYASSAFWKKLYTEYKLLRVLDLGAAVKVESVPSDIDNLGNLRYLRLFLSSIHIPESIYNLRNLQMLFVEGTNSLNIPLGSLLKLQNLQQLKVGASVTKLYGNIEALLSKKQLNSLQVLSSIYPNSDIEDAIMNGLCPNLRKLSLCSSHDHSWSLKNFLEFLPHLESLKICILSDPNPSKHLVNEFGDPLDINNSPDIFRGVIGPVLPSTVTKITLNYSDCSEATLNMLGEFPNLRILKLQDMELADQNATYYWFIKFRACSFPRLHTLHFDNVNGGSFKLPPRYHDRWPAFYQLRHLLVKRCTSEFDLDLFKLPSLKDIEVLWPDAKLANQLENLTKEGEIKCRLLVYKGD